MKCSKLTLDEHNDVKDRVHYCLYSSHPGYMTMEYIERCKTPSSGPQENIVSPAKEP